MVDCGIMADEVGINIESGLPESKSNTDRSPVIVKATCWSKLCDGPSPSFARYVYGVIFLLTNVLAWAIRDYGHAALSELRRLKGCEGADACLGAEGVLRISFGCFVSSELPLPFFFCNVLRPRELSLHKQHQTFFIVMFLSTVETKKLVDARNTWHTKRWAWKFLLWVGLMAIPFSLPSVFIHLYGVVAHLGAGLFLVIQLISVISFITWLNNCCRSEKHAKRCRVRVLIVSIVSHICSILGITLMYIWYAPRLSCKPNIIFISVTLGLVLIMTLVSILPWVNAGFLAPGLMGVYVVFLCWCAIRSEPQRDDHNKRMETETHKDWLTIASFVIAVLAIVMATFSTGIDSQTFQFKKTKAEPDDVTYGYGFFHFVFAMGAMYFAMLFISWDAHQATQRWTIDVGWASTWVRLVNESLAAVLYVWMLLAPVVRRRTASDAT